MKILMNVANVLRCFSSDCPELTVTSVVTRLGMPKANASRLLKAMRETGLLETIGESKKHRPGRLLLDISAAFRVSSSLIRSAGDVVARVSRECGHTGYVSVRDGMEVTAVTDHEGSNTLRVVSNIGRRLLAHTSATGRTLLARLSDDELRTLYGRGIPPTSSRSSITLSELLDRVQQVREQGFALSHAEATAGVEAVAVAVGDPAIGEVVSLCIVFPVSMVDEQGRTAILRGLIKGAADIAHMTGDPDFRVDPQYMQAAEG